MVGEVLEVLSVECHEGKVSDQTACGDPCVVGGSRSTPELGPRLKIAPRDGDVLAVWQNDDVRQERLEERKLLWSPVPNQGPLREFADGDERDGQGGAGRVAAKVFADISPEEVGRSVCVEDDESHEASE